MRDKVNWELDHLVAEEVLEPVQFSKWAAPIVPALKSDGQSVRTYGDFQLTVNKTSQYPIPKIQDLFVGKYIRFEAGVPTDPTG